MLMAKCVYVGQLKSGTYFTESQVPARTFATTFVALLDPIKLATLLVKSLS